MSSSQVVTVEAWFTDRLPRGVDRHPSPRLRQPQRKVLDTLVESGVARSRSDAVARCGKLVEQHSEEWLADLRSAMEGVRSVGEQGTDRASLAHRGARHGRAGDLRAGKRMRRPDGRFDPTVASR